MNKKILFKTLINELKAVLFVFNDNSYLEKKKILTLLSKTPIKINFVFEYHECLLFICAYPEKTEVLKLATHELNRITLHIKNSTREQKEILNDTGLPFTLMVTRFTCDSLLEMVKNYDCNIKIDSFDENGNDLNTILNLTLPSVLKQETTAGLDSFSLLNHLGVKPKNRLNFLLQEFNKLEANPLVKDHLWESLKIYLSINPTSKYYSRSFNKLPDSVIFFQNELLKKFDSQELIQTALPKSVLMKEPYQTALIAIIRKSMLLNMRETDTSTYMDDSSLELYHLERGISIALYGLKANRQLPYQSYVGYTVFKNGMPVSYGGSWIFGETAMFGLNILEAFRGGESGYIMCQLLRTYFQRFKLNYIEVENYQFGKDNPDGIKSGAFWFYYRYGFVPIDKKLAKIAADEFNKIKNNKAYRSSEATLVSLCESNIALSMNNKIPIKKEEIFIKIMDMIAHEFEGDNVMALLKSKEEFFNKIAHENKFAPEELIVMEEMALWAKAFKIKDKNRIMILRKMISVKVKNAFDYNELVKELLALS